MGDQTFTYLVGDQLIKDITLKVEVYDKDSMGDDELGKCDVKLNRQNLQEDTKKKVTTFQRREKGQ